MNKKTITQILLVSLIAIIFFWFYLKYFHNNLEIVEESTITDKIKINQNSSSTYIDNINYTSSDARGNKYQITAKQAEIKIQGPDEMLLENVIAYIFIKDSSTVKITSDFGKYNSKNYDTIFSKNVIIVYPGHKITGEYLDFSFLKNLGIISIDVIYTGNETNLFADKIEMNLTTKDTKIFMDNKTKKVLIKGTR